MKNLKKLPNLADTNLEIFRSSTHQELILNCASGFRK